MFLFVTHASEGVDILLPTFNDLAGDPYYMVRRTIACGIYEVSVLFDSSQWQSIWLCERFLNNFCLQVAKILSPRNGLIKAELIKLLKDDNEEVLQGLIPHVAKTCELLTQSQTIGTDQIVSFRFVWTRKFTIARVCELMLLKLGYFYAGFVSDGSGKSLAQMRGRNRGNEQLEVVGFDARTNGNFAKVLSQWLYLYVLCACCSY